MQDCEHVRQWVHRTLQAYTERGERALESLNVNDLDGLDLWMRKRNAAYHNFQTAEESLRRLGVKVGSDIECRKMLSRIQGINAQLSEGLKRVRDELQGNLTRTTAARKKLAHFRASSEQDNKFQGSV